MCYRYIFCFLFPVFCFLNRRFFFYFKFVFGFFLVEIFENPKKWIRVLHFGELQTFWLVLEHHNKRFERECHSDTHSFSLVPNDKQKKHCCQSVNERASEHTYRCFDFVSISFQFGQDSQPTQTQTTLALVVRPSVRTYVCLLALCHSCTLHWRSLIHLHAIN